jgi:hypothetical protein
MSEKARESRARRLANRQGYFIKKSRVRNWNINNQQGYMIVDAYINGVVAGSQFDLSLDEVENFLNE